MQAPQQVTISSLNNNHLRDRSHMNQDDSSKTITHKKSYCVIVIFIILGFYFLILGLVQLVTNNPQNTYTIQLQCSTPLKMCKSNPIFLSFSSEDTVSIYLSSKNLNEHDIYTYLMHDSRFQQTLMSIDRNCGNYRTNGIMNKNVSVNGMPLAPDNQAIPCGRLSYYYPDGVLQMIQIDSQRKVNISTDQLISQIDQEQPIGASQNYQWINFNNKRFESWMKQPASLSSLRYWGKVSQQISGNYSISYTFNDQRFTEYKYELILSNNKAFGGYNIPLCAINLTFTALMFVSSMCSFLMQRRKWKQVQRFYRQIEINMRDLEKNCENDQIESQVSVKSINNDQHQAESVENQVDEVLQTSIIADGDNIKKKSK